VTLLKRILVEKRSFVLALGLAALLNVGVYALVVHPLEQRSLGAADRDFAAAATLRDAEREYVEATALVNGKTGAEQELGTFYNKVIPADLPAARRMTYASLPALARRSNVRYAQRHTAVDPPKKGAQLGHLKIRMVLQGDYDNVRRFIYALETAPEFVIIDDVTLVQGEPTKPLTLTLELSTYFRVPNGN
jgi:hypothetical protein